MHLQYRDINTYLNKMALTETCIAILFWSLLETELSTRDDFIEGLDACWDDDDDDDDDGWWS